MLMDENIDHATLETGMGVIMRETERLSDMVEELLDFSRMQSGRMKLVKSKMDVLAELSEAVIMYTERAKREGMLLIYDEPDLFVPVFGDRGKLRQVFINVIDNALKYSDPGDTTTVSARVEGNNIIIEVEDTGCGISAADLPKIKTKFYKANLTRRGSGIGLAVADEIIQEARRTAGCQLGGGRRHHCHHHPAHYGSGATTPPRLPKPLPKRLLRPATQPYT